MEEKVGAYESFFNSNDMMLVVVGKGGSGKSFALSKAMTRGRYIVYEESSPRIEGTDGLYSGPRSIYHLFDTDADLAQELKKKYGARVVWFE
jgi:hypothetical protein